MGTAIEDLQVWASSLSEQMAEDKSNDWSEEIAELTKIERRLLAETITPPTAHNYEVFGRHIAAAFGTQREWDSDLLAVVGEFAESDLGVRVGDQTPETMAFWRQEADMLGDIDYEEDDEDED